MDGLVVESLQSVKKSMMMATLLVNKNVIPVLFQKHVKMGKLLMEGNAMEHLQFVKRSVEMENELERRNVIQPEKKVQVVITARLKVDGNV